jgi:hypothetical protein
MANDAFNGSTATFPDVNTSIGTIRSINFRASGARADVTGANDNTKTYVVGVPGSELSVSVVGTLGSVDVGDTGALGVSWNDNSTSGTIAAVQVSDIDKSGSMDGEIISNITFVPSPS